MEQEVVPVRPSSNSPPMEREEKGTSQGYFLCADCDLGLYDNPHQDPPGQYAPPRHIPTEARYQEQISSVWGFCLHCGKQTSRVTATAKVQEDFFEK